MKDSGASIFRPCYLHRGEHKGSNGGHERSPGEDDRQPSSAAAHWTAEDVQNVSSLNF